MRTHARWTQADDALLLRLYEEGVPREQIATRLGRSVDAVDARRRALGRHARSRPRFWTAGEEIFLQAARAQRIPAAEIAPRLRRSEHAIRMRFRHLALTGPAARPYTPAEDALLRSSWEDSDPATLGRQLRRSPDALRLRARQLGVATVRQRARWQRHDDELLRNGYARGLTCAEIARTLLPQRTATSVAARASLLGVATGGRRWPPADDRRLAQLTGAGCTIEDAAIRLCRTPEAVRRRARNLSLPPLSSETHRRGARRWRPSEDAILRERAGEDLALLARRLGRSDQAIRRRTAILGLGAGRERSPHHASAEPTALTEPERALAVRAAEQGPRAILTLARRLDRPPAELRRAGHVSPMTQTGTRTA